MLDYPHLSLFSVSFIQHVPSSVISQEFPISFFSLELNTKAKRMKEKDKKKEKDMNENLNVRLILSK